jgi:hypothetical protein
VPQREGRRKEEVRMRGCEKREEETMVGKRRIEKRPDIEGPLDGERKEEIERGANGCFVQKGAEGKKGQYERVNVAMEWRHDDEQRMNGEGRKAIGRKLKNVEGN